MSRTSSRRTTASTGCRQSAQRVAFGTSGHRPPSPVTRWIEHRANDYLRDNRAAKRWTIERALRTATTREHDFMRAYVGDLANVIDIDAIRGAQPRSRCRSSRWRGRTVLGSDRRSVRAQHRRRKPAHRSDVSFMTLDHDGAIRMDCSSPYVMTRLVRMKDRYRVAFANDPDADRHGIVTPSVGLMNPNHYLAVAARSPRTRLRSIASCFAKVLPKILELSNRPFKVGRQ